MKEGAMEEKMQLLSEAWDGWLAAAPAADEMSPGMVKRHRSNLKIYVLPHFGNTAPDTLDEWGVREWVKTFASRKPSTQQMILSTLIQLLEYMGIEASKKFAAIKSELPKQTEEIRKSRDRVRARAVAAKEVIDVEGETVEEDSEETGLLRRSDAIHVALTSGLDDARLDELQVEQKQISKRIAQIRREQAEAKAAAERLAAEEAAKAERLAAEEAAKVESAGIAAAVDLAAGNVIEQQVQGISVYRFDTGECRIRDVDLAQKLGYSRPRDIRKIIRRLIERGVLVGVLLARQVARQSTGNAGERDYDVDEYWLTQRETLLVLKHSDTQESDRAMGFFIDFFHVMQGALQAPMQVAALGGPTLEDIKALLVERDITMQNAMRIQFKTLVGVLTRKSAEQMINRPDVEFKTQEQIAEMFGLPVEGKGSNIVGRFARAFGIHENPRYGKKFYRSGHPAWRYHLDGIEVMRPTLMAWGQARPTYQSDSKMRLSEKELIENIQPVPDILDEAWDDIPEFDVEGFEVKSIK